MALLSYIGYNCYRIMIKQCKITLIPLTMFYLCSTIIVITRIMNNACWMRLYDGNLTKNSEVYVIALKTSIVSNYFNMIMGFFQVASILELFFVCGSI